MKNYGKKISVYLLCGLLSVSSLCGSYVQGVYAFEWVGGAIGFTEALSWLLASIGVTCAVTDYANTIDGSRQAFWDRYEDEMTTHMQESGITYPTISEWKEKLQRGILDKGSECWQVFKEWASSLVSSSAGDDTNINPSNDVNGAINKCFQKLGINATSELTSISNFKAVGVMKWSTNTTNYRLMLFTADGSYTWNDGNITCSNSGTYCYRKGTTNAASGKVTNSSLYSIPLDEYTWYLNNGDNYPVALIGFDSIITSRSDIYNLGSVIGGGSESVGDENFNTLDNVDVNNLDIISSDTPDENASEVAIPMPGVGTSDNTESSTAYDNIIDAINQGLISLDDGIAQIQDLMRVIVFDDTTEDVIPFQDDGEGGNKKKDDVIQDNKNNLGFTLGGLENVFPFCIPWDIYAFINLLNATPEAPVFNLPFPNIEDPSHPLSVEVDLTPWDDAMRIFRLAEDFLFIIGLAFLTRSMIGAGGGDD